MMELLQIAAIFAIYAVVRENYELRKQRRDLHDHISELQRDAEARAALWQKRVS